MRLKPESIDDLHKPLGASATGGTGSAAAGLRLRPMLAGGAICAVAIAAGWGVFQSAGMRNMPAETAATPGAGAIP